MSEEIQKDFVLDDEEYHKVSLEQLKEKFESWLDWNMTLLEEKPEFHIKKEDRVSY